MTIAILCKKVCLVFCKAVARQALGVADYKTLLVTSQFIEEGKHFEVVFFGVTVIKNYMSKAAILRGL